MKVYRYQRSLEKPWIIILKPFGKPNVRNNERKSVRKSERKNDRLDNPYWICFAGQRLTVVAVGYRYLLIKRFEYCLRRGQYRDAALGENRSGGVVKRNLYRGDKLFSRDLSLTNLRQQINYRISSGRGQEPLIFEQFLSSSNS